MKRSELIIDAPVHKFVALEASYCPGYEFT
jgi:hypothetical protein